MGNSGTTKSKSPEKRDAKTSQDRLSEATTDKTVSDLEDSEKVSDSTPATPSDKTSVPSPDGMLDEPDGIKDAGPI
ncbi:MAG: hypothetical protein H0U18_01640 [Pyrinomonadaceae bacterium]|jgi:hypothetical protein|nr:hypothetical protein [Pyrinomonadaceae bacterium]